MKTILYYLKPYRFRMLRGFLVKILGTFADLGLPWVLAYMGCSVVFSGGGGKTFKYQGKPYGIEGGKGYNRGSKT